MADEDELRFPDPRPGRKNKLVTAGYKFEDIHFNYLSPIYADDFITLIKRDEYNKAIKVYAAMDNVSPEFFNNNEGGYNPTDTHIKRGSPPNVRNCKVWFQQIPFESKNIEDFGDRFYIQYFYPTNMFDTSYLPIPVLSLWGGNATDYLGPNPPSPFRPIYQQSRIILTKVATTYVEFVIAFFGTTGLPSGLEFIVDITVTGVRNDNPGVDDARFS